MYKSSIPKDEQITDTYFLNDSDSREMMLYLCIHTLGYII